jgi:hypothetical protein
MAKKIKHSEPFNTRIPPLFLRGGILDKVKDIGARIRFMVEMPEGHFSGRIWLNLYESSRRELMDICYLEQRCASFGELSQLEWLKTAGHRLWFADVERPRCNLNIYIEKIERELKVAKEFIEGMAKSVPEK